MGTSLNSNPSSRNASARLSASFRAALWFAAGLVLLLTGCVAPSRSHFPVESSLFHTVDSGFRINAKQGTVRYFVVLEPRQPIPAPLQIVAEYENPDKPDEPLVEEQMLEPGDDYLVLESVPLTGVRSGEIYRVRVLIYSDPETKEPDDTHTVFIRSIVTTRG